MRPPQLRASLATMLTVGVAAPLAGSVGLAVLAGDWRWEHQPFHSVVEGLGAFIAVALAALLRMRARVDGREDPYLWIACALAGMGILDGFHAAVAPGRTFVWLHSTATFVGGLAFALVWLPERFARRAARGHATRWVAAGALTLALLSIAFPAALPEMVEAGRFTLQARALNLLGGAFFFAAAARFTLAYRARPSWENLLFAGHCTLFGSAGMLFELPQLWDAPWWWWHLLRLGAYSVAISYMAITYWEAEARAHELIGDLERSNRELEEFAFVASHDLQEPLRKIVSFSRLLEQDIGGQLPEKAAQDLGFVTDGARRMQKLVGKLLGLSQTGTATMKVRRVDVSECVERALEALELRIDEVGARITRDPLPSVAADPTLLTAVYQNLISNALKFVGDESPAIHLTAEQGRNGWVLGVRDRGIGIPPERHDEIFKPFLRLHGRGSYEGTGIGLAICRRAVERHGGRIWVESEPGQGTHFRFVLGGPHPAGRS